VNRFAGIMVAFAAQSAAWCQESGESNATEGKRLMASTLEKSLAKGGVILKAKLERKMPEGLVLQPIEAEPALEIGGDFGIQVGKNGVALATFETPKMRFDAFFKEGKSVQRIAWSGGGLPAPGEVALDLRQILRWNLILKHSAKAREVRVLADSTIDGMACRGVSCELPVEIMNSTPAKQAEGIDESPGTIEVGAVKARIHFGKDDGLVKQLDIEVIRQFTRPGDPLEFVNHYTFTVQKYEPGLSIEIPADLRKLLE